MGRDQHLNALSPGARLNNYRVERILGVGGFGITYKAQEEFTERKVAIKEYLPSGLAGRERDSPNLRPISDSAKEDFEWGLVRFRQEAKLLIDLKHPNIVPVLAYFEANFTGYLVMEFQDGRSLGGILTGDDKLTEDEVLELLTPLLSGVEEVHRCGILHRDIKPDNIFIRRDGSPVLLDFGAARQALSQHSQRLTAILTEGYGPYEQYDPDGNQGPWTDIYALGAVMFRCLTGTRPAAAPKRMDALYRSAEDPLEPHFAQLRISVSSAVAAATEKALAVRENQRPQSISAFRELLWPLTASEPPTSRPVPQDGRLRLDAAPKAPREAVGRRRATWIAIAVVVLGAASALIFRPWDPAAVKPPTIGSPPPEPPKAQEPRQPPEARPIPGPTPEFPPRAEPPTPPRGTPESLPTQPPRWARPPRQ